MMDTIGFISLNANDLRELIRQAVSDALAPLLKHFAPPSPASQEEDLLTRRETAALLHVSLMTLRQWELRGILRPRRISRRVLYLRDDVMATLKRPDIAQALATTIKRAGRGR